MFKHLLFPICLATVFLLLIIAVSYTLCLIQAPMQLSIFILLSLVLSSIWYSICRDTVHKYDCAMSIKSGQVWRSKPGHYIDPDPWSTFHRVKYTIIDVKKNKRGNIWVSYYIDDLAIKHENAWDFCDHAELIQDIE